MATPKTQIVLDMGYTLLELQEMDKKRKALSNTVHCYNRKRQERSILHNNEKHRVFLVVVNPYTIAMVMRYARVTKNAERRPLL